MHRPKVTVYDYETTSIVSRPNYPPKPTAVAIKRHGESPFCIVWGHPSGNNGTYAQAKRELTQIHRHDELLAHNMKFEWEVSKKHFGLTPKKQYHDTQALHFLFDPYTKSTQLKVISDELLDLPPNEQDDIKSWILKNVKEATTNKKSPDYWAGHICDVPGDLVAKYAVGDVVRTEKLFRFFWPKVIIKYKMWVPYLREMRLIPHLIAMEKKGVYVKTRQLKTGINKFESNLIVVEKKIRRSLRVGVNFDLDKKEPFADALQSSGKVESFIYTKGPKTGKLTRSVSKENLVAVMNDTYLLHMILVRGKLKTFLQTFLRPWYELGKKNSGMMYSQFNSTRSSGYGKEVGAKSGRITSAAPNFFNVPKDVDVPEDTLKIAQNLYALLPFMRNYIWPDPGKVFITRDVSQQELRILANYEHDVLYSKYLKNPFLDMHDLAQEMISEMLGVEIPRKPIKTIGFSIIYGIGLALLAKKLNLSLDKTQELKDAYLDIFPGIAPLIKELKQLERNNDYLRTWGGRVYYTEPPAMVKGRMRNFGYKMLNYLIQPSAADQTKEFFIRASEAGLDTRVVLYDQLLANAEPKTWRDEMETMREIMESIEFDILLLTDGKYGKKSWGECRKYKDQR